MEKNAFFVGFEKRAWDGDVYEDGRYGPMANRSIHGSGFVYDALIKASKDKDLEVKVQPPDGRTILGGKKDFVKQMAGLRKEFLGPKPKQLPEYRMDWHKNLVWSITADKKNPKFKGEGKYEKSTEMKILDHIYKNYDL